MPPPPPPAAGSFHVRSPVSELVQYGRLCFAECFFTHGCGPACPPAAAASVGRVQVLTPVEVLFVGRPLWAEARQSGYEYLIRTIH